MKKIIVTVLLVCVGFLCAQAEEISEVYFNPSPKGNYDVLRVGRKLNSKGGLDAASVNINGTVDAAAGGTVDGTYAYKFGTAGSGGVMGIDGRDGKINMPAANFQVTDMAVKGGEAVFAATGVSAASTIGTLGNNVNQTGILEADGDLSAVTGENLSVVITGENVAGLGMSGFELGGNRIPIPTECESSGALFWANRKASNGTTYQVLAVKRCEGQQPNCKYVVSSVAGTCGKDSTFVSSTFGTDSNNRMVIAKRGSNCGTFRVALDYTGDLYPGGSSWTGNMSDSDKATWGKIMVDTLNAQYPSCSYESPGGESWAVYLRPDYTRTYCYYSQKGGWIYMIPSCSCE